jgi:hypothetical protein
MSSLSSKPSTTTTTTTTITTTIVLTLFFRVDKTLLKALRDWMASLLLRTCYDFTQQQTGAENTHNNQAGATT